MASYSFITHWRFNAPIERVWHVLNTPEDYPDWWPCLVSYRKLTPCLAGVGAKGERVVKGRLPYTLRYVTTVTKYDPPREVAYDAEGELQGHGRFVLETEGAGTRVTFFWDVTTTGYWLNLLAPLLKWLFAKNHNWVMEEGRKGWRHDLRRSSRTGCGPRRRDREQVRGRSARGRPDAVDERSQFGPFVLGLAARRQEEAIA